jgi:hypothetical protein
METLNEAQPRKVVTLCRLSEQNSPLLRSRWDSKCTLDTALVRMAIPREWPSQSILTDVKPSPVHIGWISLTQTESRESFDIPVFNEMERIFAVRSLIEAIQSRDQTGLCPIRRWGGCAFGSSLP